MGVHEVTQEQYQRVTHENPSRFKSAVVGMDERLLPAPGSWYLVAAQDPVDDVGGMDTRLFPVEKVSWEEADRFCRRLSELPEERANDRMYRLPTEAEWEYVCRGGPFFAKPSPSFHFGYSLSSTKANFNGDFPYGGARSDRYLDRTTKVGSYPSNPLGVYDLHGNVSEWCADWYAKDYYERSPRRDPQGPDSGERRVLRGGSWRSFGRDCRAAYRSGIPPGESDNIIGFRGMLVAGARN